MKYSSYIDNKTALDWGLNVQQAVLFDWIYTLPSWADIMTTGSGKRFYHASKNLACVELPLLTDKPDTIYRYYKQLEAKGLIELQKMGKKDFIHLTKKSSSWGRQGTSDHSEINPTLIGNKSESESEINPTYNNTSIDNNTINSTGLFGETKKDQISSFRNSDANNFKVFELRFASEIQIGVDVRSYFDDIISWSDKLPTRTKTQKDFALRTPDGWISTVRDAMSRDKKKGKLKMSVSLDNQKSEMLDYLNRD